MEPTLDQLAAVLRNESQQKADISLAQLNAAIGGHLDLSSPRHHHELLRWLNRWLCRIRYPRDGESDLFGESIAAWHEDHDDLPKSAIADLRPADVDLFGDAYDDLAGKWATPRRTIGPTAASKILFVLRPETIPPWDRRIALETVGGVARAHFTEHLTQGRAWAEAILAEAEARGITDVPAYVGRPASTVAKIWDEWHYLTITRAAARALSSPASA